MDKLRLCCVCIYNVPYGASVDIQLDVVSNGTCYMRTMPMWIECVVCTCPLASFTSSHFSDAARWPIEEAKHLRL